MDIFYLDKRITIHYSVVHRKIIKSFYGLYINQRKIDAKVY